MDEPRQEQEEEDEDEDEDNWMNCVSTWWSPKRHR